MDTLDKTTEQTGSVIALACNVDDMTGEEMGFALERLLEGGALDAWLTPIVMKKSRLGTKIEVLCKAEHRAAVVALLFKHTTTLGVRECEMKRYELIRREDVVSSEIGTARVKESAGYGITRRTIEFDDAAQIAREQGISLAEARKRLEK